MPPKRLVRTRFQITLMGALLCGLQGWAVAEGPPLAESIASPPATYQGREIARTMHYLGAPWLVRQSREREEECATLLDALDIRPGQTVCDLGCGNGFYTLKLAPLVGDRGRVLAVDIQQEMLDLLRGRAEAATSGHIRPILSTAADPRLPDSAIDLVLLVDVYHEFSHPEAMLQAIRRSLKPTGRVALVEFRLEDSQVPIKRLHKMSQAQIMKEFPPAGFKLVGQFDQLPWQHLMFFARDDSPLAPIRPLAWRRPRPTPHK